VAVAAGYLIWVGLRLGGPTATEEFNDLAEAMAALVAATAAWFAARRFNGGMRTTWLLLAAASATWALGELVWTAYEIGFGIAAPFPSLADVAFVGAIPLFIGAALALPSAPRVLSARIRAVLDALLIAGAVSFASWAVWLRAVYENNAGATWVALIAATHPVADIVVLVVLVLAFGNATARMRPVVAMLIAAFVSFLVADFGFGYLELNGEYGYLGSLLDVGWLVGFELVTLAAIWPGRPAHEVKREQTVVMWQLTMPWLGAFVLIATALWLGVTGGRTDAVLAGIGSASALLFILSQAIALRDSLQLFERSRHAERQLGERTALLSQVISRAPLGIARIADDMRFIDANPRLLEMLATSERSLIGSALASYLNESEKHEMEKRLEKLRSGATDEIEVNSEMQRGDGSKIWVHRSISTIRRVDGSVDYYLVMFEDLTDKHANEQAAAANLTASERLNALKSEFMSMVSHEFRTALTGIQGYSEIMSTQGVTPDEVKEFSTDIQNDALRLNRMITEMLDLDRIESGRVSLRISSVDLNGLLQDAVNRAQATTAAHRISATLDPRIEKIDADSDRLIEVVSNLLSNAVKYSPHGGDIEVKSQLVDAGVEVSVADHGQGIPADFLSRIFGRYERYVQSGKQQVVGTGLGLAIARQIIDLHKGKIWVESTVGTGSVFHFVIPARQPQTSEVADEEKAGQVA
jgi:PAS domain S-box-containing protein